jgi:hypothetical protein
MDIRERVRASQETGGPVAKAVLAIHTPTGLDEQRWVEGDWTAHCEECGTGNPLTDPVWPCETVLAVLKAVEGEQAR